MRAPFVGQGADGGVPPAVAVDEPGEHLVPGTGARALSRNKWRLVTAHGSRTESVVLVHPFGPGDVLKDVGDGAACAGRERGPVLIWQIADIGEERVRGIALEGVFDEPGQG